MDCTCPNLYVNNDTLVTVSHFYDEASATYPTNADLTLTVYDGETAVTSALSMTMTEGDEPEDTIYRATIPAATSLTADGRLYELRITSGTYGFQGSKYMSAQNRILESPSDCGC